MSSSHTSIKSTPNGIQCLNIVNVLAYAINIIVTYVIGVAGGNILGLELNLPNNSELSEKYQTLVTPADYAFSIWAVIFLSQFVWTLLQFVVGKYRSNPLVTKGTGVGYLYMFVCVAQAIWSTLFAFEYILYSLGAMLSILIMLLRITFRLETSNGKDNTPIVDCILLKFPFHIHTGWIIAATLLNINVALVEEQQKGEEEQMVDMLSTETLVYVAYGSLLTLLLVGSYFLLRKLWTIVFVLIWASFAIAFELNEPKNQIIETFSDREISTVQYTSGGLAIGLLVTSLIYGIYSRRTSSPPTSTSASGSSSSGIRSNNNNDNNSRDQNLSSNSVDTMLDQKIKKYNDDNSTRHQTPIHESSPTTDYAMM